MVTEFLKNGGILVFLLNTPQENKLLENIRQQALIFFSDEESLKRLNKRHDALIESFGKERVGNKIDFKPYKNIVLSVSSYHRNKNLIEVFGKENSNSIFRCSESASEIYHLSSNDSFVYCPVSKSIFL